MATPLTLRATKGTALTHAEMDANLTSLRTTADAAAAAADTLTADKAESTALGVANTDQNMGSFTGTTIPDNVSAKAGMQSLETAINTLEDKIVSVEDYGTGAAAIAAMAADKGFVRIAGDYALDGNTTVDVPLFVNSGASISGPYTLTIESDISAGPHQIFANDLTVTLSGEASREIRAEWFGVVLIDDDVTDLAPRIQRAVDAMGNSREGIIDLPFGNINIMSAFTLNRGVWLRGDMIRGTVLRVLVDGFAVITSANILARVSDLNVEWWGATDTRVAHIIDFVHNECRVDDVRITNCERGIILAGSNCNARRIRLVYGFAMSQPDSFGVRVTGGACDVEDVKAETSGSFGPLDLVQIGKGAAGNIGGNQVRKVRTIGPSRPVAIYAEGGNVSDTDLSRIDYARATGTLDAACYIEASAAKDVRRVNIDGLNAFSTTAIVHMLVKTGGDIKDVTLENVSAQAGDYGLTLERQDGTGAFEDIRVGDSCDFRARTTAINRIDAAFPTLIVAGGVEANTRPVITRFWGSAADDGVYTFDSGGNLYSGVLRVSASRTGSLITSAFGEYLVRAASDPTIEPVIEVGTTGYAGVAMTGTYGTDDEMSVGVEADGTITVENRLGDLANIIITLEVGQ